MEQYWFSVTIRFAGCDKRSTTSFRDLDEAVGNGLRRRRSTWVQYSQICATLSLPVLY